MFRDAKKNSDDRVDYSNRLNNTTIHSDVTYELQPPGLTTLFLYDTPESGGDTLYIDQRGENSNVGILSNPTNR